ncbi:N-6 DNA methylase [Pseudorhodoferax sp. Leaf274]|uniref:N-6 DNA methylase n=1 Tax=Pseudorhodoferax sp. Leaf274 TaxID=1736318 RepID=UPI0007031390|nr:N-6 DNA methylase [Pseudorhodoferax sp. Leaf274]KQP49990.1 hypothetical protein ASF44_05335 [Pseudorhodoferax sp. Leaf274]
MFEQTFKNIDDILHKDAGCTSELDYTEQSSWLLFLKYLDALEQDKAAEAELEDLVDALRFGSQTEKHELSHLYEAKIKNMGNAGRNGGEYYTPRPLIRAMVKVLDPKIGERIYDGALDGTGFDLSVKNPNGGGEVVLRSPAEILDGIAALDAEIAKVLAVIRGLV